MNRYPKCDYKSCRTGLPGVIIPVITFLGARDQFGVRATGSHRGQVNVFDYHMCESCATKANPHEVMNNKRWNDLVKVITDAGAPPPDRNSLIMHLGFEPGAPLSAEFMNNFKAYRESVTKSN